MIASPPTPLFTPDPTQVAAILSDLTSTEHALADIASLYETTIDALSIWVAKPEIQDRLRAIETLAAQRARLAAMTHLPLAIGALVDMLTAYRADESRTPMRGDLKSIHLSELRRQNARRAANLIMRLARFSSPSPREEAGGRVQPSPECHRLPADGGVSQSLASVLSVPSVLLVPSPSDLRSLRTFADNSSPAPDTATHTTVQHPPSLREEAGGRVPQCHRLPADGGASQSPASVLSVLSDLSASAPPLISDASPNTADLETSSVPRDSSPYHRLTESPSHPPPLPQTAILSTPSG